MESQPLQLSRCITMSMPRLRPPAVSVKHRFFMIWLLALGGAVGSPPAFLVGAHCAFRLFWAVFLTLAAPLILVCFLRCTGNGKQSVLVVTDFAIRFDSHLSRSMQPRSRWHEASHLFSTSRTTRSTPPSRSAGSTATSQAPLPAPHLKIWVRQCILGAELDLKPLTGFHGFRCTNPNCVAGAGRDPCCVRVQSRRRYLAPLTRCGIDGLHLATGPPPQAAATSC